jgi:hypothetical protein
MASQNDSNAIKVQDLWGKYEEVTMHFNDLLMRIRVQSIGAVAAISTLVGIFSKGGGSENMAVSWLVAAALFSAVTLSWIAIFCLDFFYYNRLLTGSVKALTELESATTRNEKITSIQLSTIIEREFTNPKPQAPFGVLLFYGVVFAFLIAASFFCLRMNYLDSNQAVQEKPTATGANSACGGPASIVVQSLHC